MWSNRYVTDTGSKKQGDTSYRTDVMQSDTLSSINAFGDL